MGIFKAFQIDHITTKRSQPGPLSAMACTHRFAINVYGTASSIVGTPHRKPLPGQIKTLPLDRIRLVLVKFRQPQI